MGTAVSLESNLSAAPVQEFSRFVIPATEPHLMRWYAVYTCSQSEKTVARQMEERGIEHFLPLYPSWRQWKDRRKQIEVALDAVRRRCYVPIHDAALQCPAREVLRAGHSR
jgi:hypothetical protein